jgi:hypothetical protein
MCPQYNNNIMKKKYLRKKIKERIKISWVGVVHTCKSSSLGGQDWEDHGSRPTLANSSWSPVSKTSRTK